MDSPGYAEGALFERRGSLISFLTACGGRVTLPEKLREALALQHRQGLADRRSVKPIVIAPDLASQIHASNLFYHNIIRVGHRNLRLDGEQFSVRAIVPVWYDRVSGEDIDDVVGRVESVLGSVGARFASVGVAGWCVTEGEEGRFCHFNVTTGAKWADEAVACAKEVEFWVALQAGLPREGQAEVDELLAGADGAQYEGWGRHGDHS